MESQEDADLKAWGKVRQKDTLRFGKHRGLLWKDVPKEYLQWLGAQNKEWNITKGVRRYFHAMSARLELRHRELNEIQAIS